MRFQRRKILCQVGIAVIVVPAQGGVNTAFCFSYQQLISFQQPEELIPSHADAVLLKKGLQHDKQLPAATAWLLLSDLINLLQYQPFVILLCKLLFVMLVIGLRRVAQQ